MAPCLPNLVSGAERLGSSHSHIEVVGDPLTFESQLPEPTIDRIGIPSTLDFVSTSQIDVEKHAHESSSHVEVDEPLLAPLDVNNHELDGTLEIGDNKVPSEPITRKLRKVDGPSDLAKKESLRDVSLPLVRPIFLPLFVFIMDQLPTIDPTTSFSTTRLSPNQSKTKATEIFKIARAMRNGSSLI